MNQLVNAMLAKTPEARPSLAAVRTVIKRLRTTQLPTRSVAGAAMASFERRSGVSRESREPGIGITASRVGAEAVLPGDSQRSERRISQPLTTTPGIGIDALRLAGQSQPRFSAARPAPSPELRPAAGSQPLGPPLDPRSSASQLSGTPAPSGHPPRPRSPSGVQAPGSQPYSPDPSRSSPGAPRPHGPPTAGLPADVPQASLSQLPPTQRGVAPPPRPSVELPPPKPRRTWLAIVALLALAAAIGVGIALAGG
jgi:hypothetical protein